MLRLHTRLRGCGLHSSAPKIRSTGKKVRQHLKIGPKCLRKSCWKSDCELVSFNQMTLGKKRTTEPVVELKQARVQDEAHYVQQTIESSRSTETHHAPHLFYQLTSRLHVALRRRRLPSNPLKADFLSGPQSSCDSDTQRQGADGRFCT